MTTNTETTGTRGRAKAESRTDIDMTPQSSLDISDGTRVNSLDIMQGVALGGSRNVVKEGIPRAGFDQPWNKLGILQRNTPPARPGFVQRWIRLYDVDGRPDASNVTRSFDNDWTPRLASTIDDGRSYPTAVDSTHGTVIAVRGMVLMERPADVDAGYNRRLRAEIDRLTDSVYQGANTREGSGDSMYRTTARSSVRTTMGGRDASALVDD